MVREKQKLSEDLNNILGTQIDFEKLSVSELKDLYEIFSTPTKMFQLITKAARSKWPASLMQKPLGELLNVGQGESKGGIFGLGLIPELGIRDKITSRLGENKIDNGKSEK